MYLNKLITGRELTTVINKAVDNNEKNKVSKDKNGFYLDDNENSINIDVKILDSVFIDSLTWYYISLPCSNINNRGWVQEMNIYPK